MLNNYRSWGNYLEFKNHKHSISLLDSKNYIALNKLTSGKILPYGNGRSYGDVCLNDRGTLLDTRDLNDIIHFDSKKGILKCEAGLLLADILELIMPHGWFLPVTPGTRFVTLGGAIANDIHGKNHHGSGSFGCHLRSFELLRSDGVRLQCSDVENKDFFSATIGGLGLTGVIVWAEISLKPINNEFLDVETICFDNLEEFFALSKASNESFEYTVSWIDCLAKKPHLGKGVFIRANHNTNLHSKIKKSIPRVFNFPFTPYFSLINKSSLRFFNTLFFLKSRLKSKKEQQHIYSFFYPLDSIQNWNQIYGKKGFLQYQCVIPNENACNIIEKILEKISNSGQGSFLSVLKVFGEKKSPGMLSFPQHGTTLALDFPNKGKKLLKLLNELDKLVIESHGAIYPAKDSRMSKKTFQTLFPAWQEFSDFIDPEFSSSFWRRVTGVDI